MNISFNRKNCPEILSDIQEMIDLHGKLELYLNKWKVQKSSISFECRQEDKDMIANFKMRLKKKLSDEDSKELSSVIGDLVKGLDLLRCTWYANNRGKDVQTDYRIIRFAVVWEADY